MVQKCFMMQAGDQQRKNVALCMLAGLGALHGNIKSHCNVAHVTVAMILPSVVEPFPPSPVQRMAWLHRPFSCQSIIPYHCIHVLRLMQLSQYTNLVGHSSVMNDRCGPSSHAFHTYQADTKAFPVRFMHWTGVRSPKIDSALAANDSQNSGAFYGDVQVACAGVQAADKRSIWCNMHSMPATQPLCDQFVDLL